MIENIRESHSCDLPFDTKDPQNMTIREMNVSEFHKHLSTDCAHGRACFDCEAVFDTKSQFLKHIKFDCQYVQFHCNDCSKSFSRLKFRLPPHKCYFDALETFPNSSILTSDSEKSFVQNFLGSSKVILQYSSTLHGSDHPNKHAQQSVGQKGMILLVETSEGVKVGGLTLKGWNQP